MSTSQQNLPGDQDLSAIESDNVAESVGHPVLEEPQFLDFEHELTGRRMRSRDAFEAAFDYFMTRAKDPRASLTFKFDGPTWRHRAVVSSKHVVAYTEDGELLVTTMTERHVATFTESQRFKR